MGDWEMGGLYDRESPPPDDTEPRFGGSSSQGVRGPLQPPGPPGGPPPGPPGGPPPGPPPGEPPTAPIPEEPPSWRDLPPIPPEFGQDRIPPEDDYEPEPPPPPVRDERPVTPVHTAPDRKPWAFAFAGLAIGLLIGVGLLLWLRSAMAADQRTLEERLKTVEASATAASEEVSSLQARLAQADASITALASQNASLTSQLQSATAALAEANSKLAIASKTITFVERTVSPTSVVKGAPLVLEVKLQGAADKVQMRITGVSPVSFSKTYSLTKVGTSGGVQTWRRTIDAPNTVGTYRYAATAFIGDKEFTMSGVSAWTFEVKAGP